MAHSREYTERALHELSRQRVDKAIPARILTLAHVAGRTRPWIQKCLSFSVYRSILASVPTNVADALPQPQPRVELRAN
jgi:hypothetical protein